MVVTSVNSLILTTSQRLAKKVHRKLKVSNEKTDFSVLNFPNLFTMKLNPDNCCGSAIFALK